MGVRRCLPSSIIGPDDACDIRITVPGNECDKYPAKQHARKTALKLGASSGLIYLAGQPTINWGDSDQPRFFRQRRYFYYLTGTNEADCHVTYDIKNDLLTLYVPDFDLHHAIWMGPTLTVDEALQRYDVDRVRYHASLSDDIQSWARKSNGSNPIYILHETQKPAIPTTGLHFDHDRLVPAMNIARMVKDEYEIRMIRRANEISGLAHRKILETIHKMKNETEIEGLFLDTCVSHGAKNQSYEIIAGSGENAAVLHYVKNDEPLHGRQLVCLDAGAEWNCYASDVTRTIPLPSSSSSSPSSSLSSDWPSDRAKAIYQIVEDIQERCIKLSKEGSSFALLQKVARFYTVKGLRRLGVLRGNDINEILASGASNIFFPHGLGHHVGLEVHDVTESSNTPQDPSSIKQWGGRAFVPPVPVEDSTLTGSSSSSTRSDLFEEGMIITVEPGIYFSRLALRNARTLPLARYIDFEEAEKYLPVGGVRIEDDVLITKGGPENLTTAPKGQEMLEILRRGIDR
ncbi:Creatinase/aminopeptidase [Aspergillus steynii IBT 23096]|uniref:Xaa-Pro aminopeptidase n=1 Tax=Aspergillus steynii IBT 23096 TaxID=1392250 RepID=A0A2I2G5V7_9EURO|nr:Creatinase/aminopeptidase [Aspergillus steynii IBT 23096]PLB48258.1 Creatinase/aminopeptidase [Aspergillus steynii IBT 23096]